MGQFCWKWPSQYFHFSSNLGKLARCPIFIHIYLSQSAIYYIPCPLPSGYFLSTLSFFPCAWVESMKNWIKGNTHCLYFYNPALLRRGEVYYTTVLKKACFDSFDFFWNMQEVKEHFNVIGCTQQRGQSMIKLITEQKVYLLQFGEQSPGTLAKLNCLLLPRGVKAVPWCHGAMVPLD